ncbi:MAG TPA: hypothetical protein VHO71_01490 [Caproiciproducens sp.]|nr:hypothetical protein [Caproiciproducens sp.]
MPKRKDKIYEKTNSKTLSLLLSLAMLLGMVSMGSVPAFADSNSSFAGGTGTKDDPYQIETPAQLENMKNYLSDSGKGVYFKLTHDIDSGNFTAIGDNNQHEFGGFFNGDGHYVSVGIAESDPCHFASSGLFRAVSETGEIDNLEVRGTATGSCDIGELAGINRGTIINCSSSVKVTGGDNYQFTGGLVGVN